MTRWTAAAAVIAFGAAAAASVARAQPPQRLIDIEVPTEVLDDGGGGAGEDTQLDLANVVQSAARGVTTVQEAPVIVTVITSDEIADRQYSRLEEVFDTVPGWMRSTLVHQFPVALVRGQVQAVQFLHDGTSLFDPTVNIASVSRVQPLETIKRVEMITGPGGVLWGSNSLVGILNVITKDADDVAGVEVGGQLGGGPGDPSAQRAYFMYGAPRLAGGRAKLFLHGSYDTYDGAQLEAPSLLFFAPLPQPNGPVYEGPVTTADPPRSYLISLDGKLTIGKLQLRFQAPFGERETPFGFSGGVVRQRSGEDTATDAAGKLLCPYSADPRTWLDATGNCIDKGRTARANRIDYFDRYLVAEYRSRLAHGTAGISIKGYAIQFVRNMPKLAILQPVPVLLQGGLELDTDLTNYRVGAAVDGDVELSPTTRLLYGAEGFNEFTINDVTTSRQGDGNQVSFAAPYDLTRLPVPCPRTLDVASRTISFVPGCPLTELFPASRTVLGAYLDPQWRPSRALILDAGARVSYSPTSLGLIGYEPNLTASGTAVYGFAPGWHLKLNFAQGFRPPVFNNVVSNGESVQLDGRLDLKVETSQAEQAELNARIFKGEGRIRELSFRADYSYTQVSNLIQLVGGRYDNTADRGINSAELLAKLYVQGGHRLELGYTWLQINTADTGQLRNTPENWMNLAGVFDLVDGALTATTNLRVVGTYEDPNRLIEYRDYGYDGNGRVIRVATGTAANLISNPSELVLDRLPPQADLEVGVTWTPSKQLRLRATLWNALDGRYYIPDPFGSYQPRLEFQPYPLERVRAYVQASYQY